MTQPEHLDPVGPVGPGTATYPLMSAQEDPAELLTVDELDQGSQLLRADLLAAVQPGHPRRSLAIAVTAWLLARRQDRKVQLAPFRALTFLELCLLLWPVDQAPDAQAEDDLDDQADAYPAPVDVEPAVEVDDDQAALAALSADPLAEELEARPTDPAPAP